MKKILWVIVKTLTKLMVSTIIAFYYYRLLAPFAYAERGYFAIGGEGIIALAVGIGTYMLLNYVDGLPENGRKKSAEVAPSSGQTKSI